MSVYKSEKAEHLNQALKSIWDDQTLKPNQIVLIEDGPLGNELHQVINNWEQKLDEVLYVIVNHQNLGLTKSLNIGIKSVTGDLIARMDSDDVSDPRRFERQVSYLERNTDVSVVGGSIQEFDDNNNCLNIRHYPANNDEVFRYIHKASPLAHPTVMMRRNIFDEGLHYDERYRTSQDIALWFDVLLHGYKIANIEETVLYFRRNKDVFKRRSRKKANNEFKIYVKGIYRLNGIISLKYMYPFMRYLFRLMPQVVIKWIYSGKIRKSILEK